MFKHWKAFGTTLTTFPFGLQGYFKHSKLMDFKNKKMHS